MPDKTRPTRAALDAAEARAVAAEKDAADAQAYAASWHERLSALEAVSEPEADALAACTKAIEAMYAGDRHAQDRYTNTTAAPFRQATTPEAHFSAVGRILLHLAHRYGVPLVATEPEVPEPGCAVCGRP